MTVKTITKIDERSENCILVVGGINCVACKQVVTALNKTKVDYPVFYIDIENAIDFANKTQMRSLPSVFLLNGEQIKAGWVGNIDIAAIIKEINK